MSRLATQAGLAPHSKQPPACGTGVGRLPPILLPSSDPPLAFGVTAKGERSAGGIPGSRVWRQPSWEFCL